MVACGSWFHLSDVLIDGFADDVGNRAVLVLGDLFEFSELLRFQPDRRKCFRHDLIVYQRYTMSSVIASPAKINRQLSQAPTSFLALVVSSGDFALPIFFSCVLAVHRNRCGSKVGTFLGWCRGRDRKSTRLNSSHTVISYAVFCL